MPFVKSTITLLLLSSGSSSASHLRTSKQRNLGLDVPNILSHTFSLALEGVAQVAVSDLGLETFYSNASNLRGRKQRELGLTSTVLNVLTDTFSPEIEGMARAVVKDDLRLDPFYLGAPAKKIGSSEFPLPTESCQNSSLATYFLLGTITGLSDFDVAVKMVPGSDNVRPLGLGGAKWSGTWIVKATFANVTAETIASLKALSCDGDPIEQPLTGASSLSDTSLEIEVTLGGKTSNVFRIPQSSLLTTVQLERFDFGLGLVDTGFNITDTIVPAFDLSNNFNAFLINAFSGGLESDMIDGANENLKQILPIGPGDVGM